jgi:transcription elongation factor Elf1
MFNRKKPCKTCIHCAKIFSRTTGLTLHKSVCPVVKNRLKSLNLEIAEVNGHIDYYTRQLDFYYTDESKTRTKMINEKDQLIVQRKNLQDTINLIKS